MIDRFLSEKWEYDSEYDNIIVREDNLFSKNNEFTFLELSNKYSQARENIRLVTTAPEMYKFFVNLLQDEQFLHNPVKIALTAQKILMRINGELMEAQE